MLLFLTFCKILNKIKINRGSPTRNSKKITNKKEKKLFNRKREEERETQKDRDREREIEVKLHYKYVTSLVCADNP